MILLPDNIKNSGIFTFVQLQLLAAVNETPVVDPSFEDDKLKNIFQYYSLTPDELDVEVHKYAAELLEQGKINAAWQVLLSANVM